MRPVLIDTNAYTGFKRGYTSIKEIIQAAEQLVMSPVMLGEVLAGFERGNKSLQNRQELQQFLDSSRVNVLPLTADTAHFYSRIFTSLKKKGRPIPTNDMWIAAQALEHGCVVCTYDRHFEEIEGLILVRASAGLVI